MIVMRRKTLTLSAHGAVELVAGIAMMIAPAGLGFGAAGIVVSVLLGALLAGMGLGLTARASTSGRPGHDITLHTDFDTFFLVATAAAALALAVTGDRAAAAFLAVIVAVQAAMSFRTRYVLPG